MRFNLQTIKYAVIPKDFLKDKKLSLKAKGMLSIMFSLPDEWNYSLKGLQNLTNVGEKQIKNIIQELKTAGYLEIKKERDGIGRFEYVYNIYFEPIPTEYNTFH